ncbi:MAG: M48 family metallopeptidase [Deltaproteobacteria bacterium]|nr:M48 family metallopeptidase [Deltaproteobacteria bacterium]
MTGTTNGTTFRGVVTIPGASTGAPATIEITSLEVRAIAANGDVLSWPLASLEVTPGGYDGDFVFLRSPEQPATLSTTDLAVVEKLAELGGPAMAARLGSVRKHRGSASFWRTFSLVAASLTALALVVLVLVTPTLLSWSVGLLPTSFDRQLGDLAASDLAATGETVTDPRVVSFVEAIVARLEESGPPSEHDYRVSVIENDEVNAFALPGGQIVVWTGLIREAESAEQIAGVLAHELAHVERRHGLRNVAHRAGIAIGLRLLVAIFLGGDLDGFTSLAADVAVIAASNDYGQDQESEADADAVARMHAAGLDPNALAGFFRVMSRAGVGELPAFASWLSTHPDHETRITAIESLTRQLGPAASRPLALDLDAVKAALAP